MPGTPVEDLEPPPHLSEVEHAIRTGKSPGLDGIPAELIQSTGKHGMEATMHKHMGNL